MAMLLAMFQKMRLIREKNQLVLEQTQFSSKLSRIEKNIERKQKYYTSLFAQIDSQAKMMQSQATVMFQGMLGIGGNSVNPYDYTGMNGYVEGVMSSLFTGEGKGLPVYDKNGDIEKYIELPNYNEMMNEFRTNGKFLTTEDGKEYENFSKEEVDAFNTARTQAMRQQQMVQYQSQQMSQQYANNVSIWVDAQKAQLEAEQDAVLEPLNYEQTMLELEKEQKDMRLKRIEAELQRYNELCSKEAENAAPSFGLG